MKFFLLTILFTFCLSTTTFAQNEPDCEPYKEGFFRYDGDLKDVIIYRKGNYQLEYDMNKKEWFLLKLVWTGDCSYWIKFIKMSDSKAESEINQRIVVDIVYTNSKMCKFEAIDKKNNTEHKGNILLGDEEITESERKKTIKIFDKAIKSL